MPRVRIPQSERLCKSLNGLMAGGKCLEGGVSILDEVVKAMVAYLVTKALEEELCDWLGREQYSRNAPGHVGYRNGYDEAGVKTLLGKVGIKKPKVRGSEVGYRSVLWPHFKAGSVDLRRKVLEMYVRGLSTRDIEDLFRDSSGQTLLSRSAVSVLTEDLWHEYEQFQKRDLSRLAVEYLFLDAVYESLRKECGQSEGILVAWGILADGRKVLLHLALGNKESEVCWKGFARDLVRRGLRPPVMVTADGAPGLMKVIELIFRPSLRQRCLAHKIRNVLAKVPESRQAEVKRRVQAVYYAPNAALAY